jgi:hypothetical protein
LAGIEAGAEVNTVDSVNTQTGAVVLDADDIDDSATTNKFTTQTDIDKLAGIEAGAEVNTVDSVNSQTGVVVLDADDIDDTSTTNKFTTQTDIDKLAGIEAGAEVNTVDSVNGATGTVVLDADDIDDTSTTNKFTNQTDIDKLAGIEALADVTDATNVAAAGALMDGVAELADLADVAATAPSDGQVLTYDTVNGWQPETPSGGGTIDGSGTADYIAKWSDSDTLTDSVIQDDGTTVSVGGVLAVSGDVSIADKIIHTGDTNTAIRFPSADTITLETDGSERMRIDSSGDVGIGTTSPTAKLEITPADNEFDGLRISRGVTFEDSQYSVINHHGGAMTLTSVLTGFDGVAGTIKFMRSSDGTSTAESVRITSLGVVLIGQTTVSGVDGALPDLNSTELGRGFLNLNRDDTATTKQIRFGKDGTERGSIQTTTTTSYLTSSDYRLKENVVPLDNALDRISALKPSRFNFIEEPETTVDGFLAHQVQDIVPEAISGEKDAVDANGNPEYQSIDQSKLVPLLVGAIQELKGLVQAQQAEIESLKSQLNG